MRSHKISNPLPPQSSKMPIYLIKPCKKIILLASIDHSFLISPHKVKVVASLFGIRDLIFTSQHQH